MVVNSAVAAALAEAAVALGVVAVALGVVAMAEVVVVEEGNGRESLRRSSLRLLSTRALIC